MAKKEELCQEEKMPRKSKKQQTVLTILVLTLLVVSGGFWFYVNDYYKAEDIALSVLQSGDFQVEGNLTILKGSSDKGIIFYPGAKVEAIAYLPILEKLQQRGFTCVLVEMPFHMAIFGVNQAEKVFGLDLDVAEWYMAGHSMGGGMASSYASDNEDKVAGLILMGAYVYGSYPPEKSITIYGSYNDNLEEKMDYTENIYKIEGGNHAMFGNYGKQKGDPDGDITTEEQQNQTVDLITAFVGIA